MERDVAIRTMQQLLALMKEKGGSDLFITAGFPPAIKINGQMTPVGDKALPAEASAMIIRAIMNDRQIKEFESTNECNFAISPPNLGRFRVNAFVQQGRVGGVLRTIQTEIPTFEQLRLPEQLSRIVMEKRGLVLMVGGTGSGKSTSLAAMMGHRNKHSRGHIITIEDPVEYVHPHLGCVITQREVGADTHSWDAALKNTLRQAPDVILIGEIRTRETMEYAINFAETGHLVLSTLHANSANQAMDRIINFFPEEKRAQLLMDVSFNLKAIISQRLIRREAGGRVAAIEIMLNSPLIADLIFKGEIHELKAVMARSNEQGMVTFDQALYRLFEAGEIGYEEALRNADSQNELRLNIKLNSRRARQNLLEDEGVKGLKMHSEDDPRAPAPRA
jgi:twitching motility protein PilU